MSMKQFELLGSVLAVTAAAAVGFAARAAAPATASEVMLEATEATTYRIDPVHSVTLFRIRHLDVAYYHGRFNEMEGAIHWDADDPANSRISITINAESVDTKNDDRDNHLRSPDFFNVAEFPEITFTSTRIERRSEDQYRVTGELSLHGRTQTINVDLNKTGEGEHPRTGRNLIGFESVFGLNRTDYGMTWGVDNNMLGDRVRLTVAIEAIAQ